MSKAFVMPSSSFIADAIENGMNAIFKELQDEIGQTDGGIAGEHYASMETDDLLSEMLDYFTRYLELERIYAPDDIRLVPEDEASLNHDPNYLQQARMIEAIFARQNYDFSRLGGLDDHGIFKRKANSPDELVMSLALGFADRMTHTMTVEFAPLTSNVVHVEVKEIEEILISSGLLAGAFADDY